MHTITVLYHYILQLKRSLIIFIIVSLLHSLSKKFYVWHFYPNLFSEETTCVEQYETNKNDDLNIFTHQNIITRERIREGSCNWWSSQNKRYKFTGLKTNAFFGLRFIICFAYKREEREKREMIIVTYFDEWCARTWHMGIMHYEYSSSWISLKNIFTRKLQRRRRRQK